MRIPTVATLPRNDTLKRTPIGVRFFLQFEKWG